MQSKLHKIQQPRQCDLEFAQFGQGKPSLLVECLHYAETDRSNAPVSAAKAHIGLKFEQTVSMKT